MKRYDKQISILIPTRDRAPYLVRLVESIIKKTVYLRKIELIFVVDIDDDSAIPSVNMAVQKYPKLSYKIIIRQRADSLVNDYMNVAAKISEGAYLFPLCDDAVLTTAGWDQEFYDRCHPPDLPAYYDTMDTTRNFEDNGEFSCFPIISRGGYDALGYLFHPADFCWGADKNIHRIYDSANCIHPMDVVNITHHHERDDPINKRIRDVNLAMSLKPTFPNYSDDVFRLVEAKKAAPNAV